MLERFRRVRFNCLRRLLSASSSGLEDFRRFYLLNGPRSVLIQRSLTFDLKTLDVFRSNEFSRFSLTTLDVFRSNDLLVLTTLAFLNALCLTVLITRAFYTFCMVTERLYAKKLCSSGYDLIYQTIGL